MFKLKQLLRCYKLNHKKMIILIICFMIQLIFLKTCYEFISFIFKNVHMSADMLDVLLTTIKFSFVFVQLVLFNSMFKEFAKPIEGQKIEDAFRKSGLVNSYKETIEVLGCFPDANKKYGTCYIVATNGISIVDIDRRIDSIQTAWGKQIYEMCYLEDIRYLMIKAIHKKYNGIKVITKNDDFLTKSPNCLLVGGTGSGKTNALKVIVSKYANFLDYPTIVVCDYKQEGFSLWRTCEHYFGFEDCLDGIELVYQEFQRRLRNNSHEANYSWVCLIIDEYPSLIKSLPNDQAKKLMNKLAVMLMLSRSLKIKICITAQRGDAKYFDSCRDNFKEILGMGNLSKESKAMLFTDFTENMNDRNKAGQGYLLIDGEGLCRVQVEYIKNNYEIYNSIADAMNRNI